MVTLNHKIIVSIGLFLGVCSFLCVLAYWLALTDIWHASGSPDFWAGKGPSATEWKWLAILFWPIFLFHLFFFAGAGAILRSLFPPRAQKGREP